MVKTILVENYTVKIGQNQGENQTLLETMDENDTWFHLADYPSPHLVINADYQNLSKQIIYHLAVLLKQNTKYKHEHALPIHYCLRKELGLTSTPGQVQLLGKYKTIRV
jgi:predicted ribosome quality control (RQC) complex YloA/Tae2 family protein